MGLLDWLAKFLPPLTNFWFRLMEWLIVVSWLSVAKDKIHYIWLDIFTYVSALLIAPYIVFSLFNMYLENQNTSKQASLKELTLKRILMFTLLIAIIGTSILALAKVVGSTAILLVNKTIC